MYMITAGIIGDGITHGYGMIHGYGTVGDGIDHGVMAHLTDGVGILGDGMSDLPGDGITGDMVILIMVMGIMAIHIIITTMEIITEEVLPITQAEEEVC